ncbi:PTS system mannose/fructose/N-acetylgalactosamine-transporter subunit IIB [Latilactobacillus sakei]|uniref:PTS system mannose/fructose/N-acetylgalactosamine-transporter subunit IIB n=1 Tax=Latilactobacillus sakei TaxID=1599 RepID=UPI00388921DE
MISMVRIDDRLIHGQVAVMWSKELGIDRIIVANDEVVQNEIQKSALLLAAPASVKAAIIPVDKAITIVNDKRAENMKILVLVNNPADMLKILQSGAQSEQLNISNYGRQLGGGENPKKEIATSVYLDSSDVDQFHSIFTEANDVIYQPVPGQPAESLKMLIEKNFK